MMKEKKIVTTADAKEWVTDEIFVYEGKYYKVIPGRVIQVKEPVNKDTQ